MLLLVGDAEEGDAMPDAVAQPSARDFDARAVVAGNSVLDALTDRLGARLDGAVERALGVGQRRVALARHRPRRLHVTSALVASAPWRSSQSAVIKKAVMAIPRASSGLWPMMRPGAVSGATRAL
eukprot:6470455-Prymnesium_polylepis.1